MRQPVSFVTTFDLDELMENYTKANKITKAEFIENVLKDYIGLIREKKVMPVPYPIKERDRKFLSVKIDISLNREIKHLSVMNNVYRQDIFNNAMDAFFQNHK